MTENILSVATEMVDQMPIDLESRLLLPANIAFQTTAPEFLTFSKKCAYKTEFHEGFAFSFHENLSGNVEQENTFTQNFLSILEAFSKKKEVKLRPFQDLQIYIYLPKSCVYRPKISVFKEKNVYMIYKNEQKETLKAALNPALIFEMLLENTDQSEKIKNYKQIESLKQMVFANPKEPFLVLHNKVGKNWIESKHQNPDETVKIMDCPVLIKNLYNCNRL